MGDEEVIMSGWKKIIPPLPVSEQDRIHKHKLPIVMETSGAWGSNVLILEKYFCWLDGPRYHSDKDRPNPHVALPGSEYECDCGLVFTLTTLGYWTSNVDGN